MLSAYPWTDENDIEIIEWKYPSNEKQQLRYKTYKDLWERGYYVTNGEKFGGDFLAYPGNLRYIVYILLIEIDKYLNYLYFCYRRSHYVSLPIHNFM